MSVFAVVGLLILTLKTPQLARDSKKFSIGQSCGEIPTISIIIPARNEEKRLGQLLESISRQSFAPFEVIVVNDQSTDKTAEVAKNFGATVIESGKRPADFAPKPFVCDVGFKQSTGSVVLFLDADTCLAPNFVETVASFFSLSNNNVLSIQPFHRTSKLVQSLSFYFHFVSIVASGLLSLLPFSLGVFGPCIAMRRQAYESVGGFTNEKVKSSIIEDVELGEVLKREGFRPDRFLGTGLIEYEMYSSFKEMFFGWVKNISRGASKTNPILMIVMIAYFGAMISIPYFLIFEDLAGVGGAYLILEYILLWLITINVAVRLGNYFISSIFYPFSLIFFFVVFAFAGISQILKLETKWAGRAISSRK